MVKAPSGLICGLMVHITFGEVVNGVFMCHQRGLVRSNVAEYESKHSASGDITDHLRHQRPAALNQSENRGLLCFRGFPPT